VVRPLAAFVSWPSRATSRAWIDRVLVNVHASAAYKLFSVKGSLKHRASESISVIASLRIKFEKADCYTPYRSVSRMHQILLVNGQVILEFTLCEYKFVVLGYQINLILFCRATSHTSWGLIDFRDRCWMSVSVCSVQRLLFRKCILVDLSSTTCCSFDQSLILSVVYRPPSWLVIVLCPVLSLSVVIWLNTK